MLLVVLFLFAVNLFFYSGRFHSIDEMALLATTESMVKWQRADIARWPQQLALARADQQGLSTRRGPVRQKLPRRVAGCANPRGMGASWQVQAALLQRLVVALTGGVVFRLRADWDTRLRVHLGRVVIWPGDDALVMPYLFSEPVAGWAFYCRRSRLACAHLRDLRGRAMARRRGAGPC
jgi:hypothetical protein